MPFNKAKATQTQRRSKENDGENKFTYMGLNRLKLLPVWLAYSCSDGFFIGDLSYPDVSVGIQ